MTLPEKTKAPDFELPDQDGKIHALKDYLGKWVVLYFYPKDDTPGCTTEACNFRDDYSQYEKEDIVILGVSKDSTKSHAKFIEKYQLPFPLLADEEHKTIEAYQSWGLKKMMGREYMGTLRNSYLIDPEGMIAKAYPNVKPADHSAEILADLQELKK